MTKRRTHSLSALVVATLLIVGGFGPGFPASGCASARACVRSQDEVWLICTRHTDCCDAQHLCVRRYLPGQGFVDASIDEYLAGADTQAIVTVYVHGNRVEPELARERGLRMYREIVAHACPHQRIRHVIWSWCSTPIKGPLRDARIKARRTFLQSYLLADFVARHDCHACVSLVGFSYGGRIILGAQHLLGGGTLCGRSLASEVGAHIPRTRVVVWAPAMPADWICVNGMNGLAFQTMDRMLLYYNPRDPALRVYRAKINESDADALGLRGVSVKCLDSNACCVEQRNVARLIGAHHEWQRYVDSASIICRTSAYALWR